MSSSIVTFHSCSAIHISSILAPVPSLPESQDEPDTSCETNSSSSLQEHTAGMHFITATGSDPNFRCRQMCDRACRNVVEVGKNEIEIQLQMTFFCTQRILYAFYNIARYILQLNKHAQAVEWPLRRPAQLPFHSAWTQ